MKDYVVGQIATEFYYHLNVVQFDIEFNKAILVMCFKKPTQKEITQFNQCGIEIRFVELGNIIMITAKVGDLNWVDAPYTSFLSKGIQILKNEEKLDLQVVLADSSTGKVEATRNVALSEKFTGKIFTAIQNQMKQKFNQREYDENLAKIYSKYTTKEIVSMSKDYCKIRE